MEIYGIECACTGTVIDETDFGFRFMTDGWYGPFTVDFLVEGRIVSYQFEWYKR